MRALILTEGGSNIGFGHLTRCISLYQAFNDKGIIPEFIINCYGSILNLSKGTRYQMFNWLKYKDKLFEIVIDSGFVIIDSYLADKSLYEKISEITSGRLIMIDDYNRLDYPKGILVNHSILANKLNYRRKRGVTYLLGNAYTMLRKSFWKIPKKKINRRAKSILISFGGINHSYLVKKIIKYLKNKFDFNFYVINSKQKKLCEKEIIDLMFKADICVSGGGQTTYELARVGVPTIGICFAENQLLNLQGWQEKGFIEYIGNYSNEDLLKKIELAIRKIFPYKERIKRHQIGRNYIDGKGLERIIRSVSEKFELNITL